MYDIVIDELVSVLLRNVHVTSQPENEADAKTFSPRRDGHRDQHPQSRRDRDKILIDFETEILRPRQLISVE